MCLEPHKIDGQRVACRYCRVCRDNRLNDLVGRCIAEQSTSSATVAVTLTYRGDVPEAAMLKYQDVQNMLKRLRRAGYVVRYICAGEYGTQKGRAHWHIVLFFVGPSPEYELERRIDWEFWPHGFSYFQQPDYKGFRYVMKYALKNQSSEGYAKSLSMSKKPPLGNQFFMEMARDLVDRRLPIHTPEYAFANVIGRNGVPRRYWLQGRMRELFLERYCDLWRIKWNEEPPYTEFLLERYLDKIAAKEMDADAALFERQRSLRDKAYRQALANKRWEPPKYRYQLGFLKLPAPIYGIAVAYSDRTAEVVIGDAEWLISGNTSAALVAAQIEKIPSLSRCQSALISWLSQQWASCPGTS